MDKDLTWMVLSATVSSYLVMNLSQSGKASQFCQAIRLMTMIKVGIPWIPRRLVEFFFYGLNLSCHKYLALRTPSRSLTAPIFLEIVYYSSKNLFVRTQKSCVWARNAKTQTASQTKAWTYPRPCVDFATITAGFLPTLLNRRLPKSW